MNNIPCQPHPFKKCPHLVFVPICCEEKMAKGKNPFGKSFVPSSPLWQERIDKTNQVFNALKETASIKGYNYSLTIENNPTKMNAHAWISGKMCITTKILESMDEEKDQLGCSRTFSFEEKVGAVLAHEFTHCQARHAAKKLQSKFTTIYPILILTSLVAAIAMAALPGVLPKLISPFVFVGTFVITGVAVSVFQLAKNRAFEYEADLGSLHHIKRAQQHAPHLFNKTSPEAAIWIQRFFDKLDKKMPKTPECLRTHPLSTNRAKVLEKAWSNLQKA
jgi:Zn-dependent protease with chaperone function